MCSPPRFPKISCDSVKLLSDDSSRQKITNINKKNLKKRLDKECFLEITKIFGI